MAYDQRYRWMTAATLSFLVALAACDGETDGETPSSTGNGASTANGAGGDDSAGQAGAPPVDTGEVTPEAPVIVSTNEPPPPCQRRVLDGKCLEPTPTDPDGDGFAAPSDCNQSDPYVHPGAPEGMCNNVDEDCNGADYCPMDRDFDGFREDADCNDEDPNINPNAREIPCNGIDESCLGYDFCDRDGDFHPTTTDCDDSDATVNPLAAETACDGIDQNCDGIDCCDNDGDGDGHPCRSDCDDSQSFVYPGAPVNSDCYVLELDVNCDGVREPTCSGH